MGCPQACWHCPARGLGKSGHTDFWLFRAQRHRTRESYPYSSACQAHQLAGPRQHQGRKSLGPAGPSEEVSRNRALHFLPRRP